MTDDVTMMPASELVARYSARSLSPVEVMTAMLARIEAVEPTLNAFCWFDPEAAMTQAQASEQRWAQSRPAGLVDGVPVTVKDLSWMAGSPTLRACPAIHKDQPWDEDSPSVARMRDQGAILYAKTNVPEFATKGVCHSRMFGVTRNPWNTDLTPAGSSGGGAASVAAGMCTIALASDAAGSIRLPAAFTALTGLKPTFGRVPDYPQSYLGSIAVIGPITRTVEDCALAMTVIGQPDVRDPYSLPPAGDFRDGLDEGIAGLRVAFSPNLGFASIDLEVAALVEQGVAVFRELDARVETVEHVHDDPTENITTLFAAGMANAFDQFGFTEEDKKLIDPDLVAFAEGGARMGVLDLLRAQRTRAQLAAKMCTFHREYPLLLAPVSAVPPFAAGVDNPTEPEWAALGEWGLRLNCAANLCNAPAASVHCGFTADGRPVGLQVIGAAHNDALVLRACRAYERARPFPVLDPERVAELSASASAS